MAKYVDTCPRQVFVRPVQLFDDDLPTNTSAQIEQPPLSLKRIPIYGITVDARSWRESFVFLLDRYGQRTTIHGLNRICQRETGFKERIFWIVGFLLALSLLTGMFALFSNSYARHQYQTTLNTTFYPIYKVPFPEIIICNNNRLNWARLNEAMGVFLTPEHRTPEFERLFIKIMAHYDNLTMSSLVQFQDLSQEPLIDLNYINFTSVVDFMSWRCDEILSECQWRWKSINCCDIFFPRRTRLGQCLAFNSVFSKGGQVKMRSDPFWPWRYGHYGRESGLQVRVTLKKRQHSTIDGTDVGILLMVSDPGVFSDYLYSSVRGNSSAHVGISAKIMFLDKLEKTVSEEIRGCVFEGDLERMTIFQDYPYQQENCIYECQQQKIIQSCGCSFDLFFPPGEYPVCQLLDMPCLAGKQDDLNYYGATSEALDHTGHSSKKSPCNCYFSCYSLQFLNNVNIETIVLPDVPNRTGSHVNLDIYWNSQYILTFKTSIVFSWLHLLVSFGGIASLLLGCSLISAVELVVFLLMETPDFIWKKRQSGKRLKVLRRNHSIKNLLNYDRAH